MCERISARHTCATIPRRNEIHVLNTRNKNALYIPSYKTTSGQSSFRILTVEKQNNKKKIVNTK